MAKKKTTKKKSGPSKADAIRQYSAKNPEAGPTEVANAVNSANKWDLTPQYVSTIWSNDKKKAEEGEGKAPAKRGRPPKKKAAKSDLGYDDLLQAKELAKQMGGVEQAKKALDALAKLTD